jgi:EAL domain-containing protein (putative c-di-GMP-specific phosphodiesterase class I)
MQLKGKTSSLILWLLMTLSCVLISAWMHRLATHTPSSHESALIKRNFDLIINELQQSLHWVASNSQAALPILPPHVDVRLVFDQQDVLIYQTTLPDDDKASSLLSSLVSFLKVPRQTNEGVTYWRDKVLLMVIDEKDDVRSITATFLDDWLLQVSGTLDYSLRLTANQVISASPAERGAILMLPAMVGKPVFINAKASSEDYTVPYLWWLSVLISALACGVLVWTLYYRPIWMRLRMILQQSKQIMQSGNFKQRVQSAGKDEIADVAKQVNAILSSLEYCYNLMAKTNLITTELLQKVDIQSTPLENTAMTEEAELKSSLDVVSRLSEAFETGALDIFVQPVFASDQKTVTSYEAMVRWMDMELGMVAPSEFVSLCEKAGLLDLLTDLMLSNALLALGELRAKHGSALVVSLNLSSAQFFAPSLLTCLNTLSEEDRKRLPNLEFEIKESTITHDFDQALILIEKLKAQNIRLCIDDYGLSRYSLMYLQRIPVDTIKLSSAFTERLAWESREAAFIDGIARFAMGLGIRVIVKNIETEAQLDSLTFDIPIEYQGVSLSSAAPLDVVLAR